MPRLLEQTEIRMEWADVARRIHHPFPESHPRSPGVHLSGVLRYIALEAGILSKPGVESTSGKQLQDVDEEEMPLRMMLGMFFEEGAVGLYPEMQWQPGELERDRVFGTPDGMSIIEIAPKSSTVAGVSKDGAKGGGPTGNWGQDAKRNHAATHPSVSSSFVVEEFKLTWKSEWNYGKDRFLTVNWLWMNQGKGYLALAQHNGFENLRHVRFHICWVNGDYRPPQPKLCRYLVEFSQAEIDNLWRLVLRNKDKAKKET